MSFFFCFRSFFFNDMRVTFFLHKFAKNVKIPFQTLPVQFRDHHPKRPYCICRFLVFFMLTVWPCITQVYQQNHTSRGSAPRHENTNNLNIVNGLGTAFDGRCEENDISESVLQSRAQQNHPSSFHSRSDWCEWKRLFLPMSVI